MGSNGAGKKNGNLTNATGVISALAGLATAATPLVINAIESGKNKSSEKTEEKVKVPDLYHKGFPIDLEQAIRILEDCGLKASRSKLVLKDANPQYKDCFAEQVINSNPKQGVLVNIGSTVCLRYIPEEVVVESQKMFDENERSKIEAREKKVAEKLERKERTRESVTGTMNKAKQEVEKIFKRGSKRKNTEEGEAVDE